MILTIVTYKIVIIIMISIMILINTSGFLSIYYEPEESAALILMKYPLTLYKTQPLLALTQPTWTDVSTCSLFPALLSLVVLPGVGIWQESRGVRATHWMYCMTPLLLPPLSIGEDRERDLHTMRKRKVSATDLFAGGFYEVWKIKSLDKRKFEHVPRCAVQRCTVHCTYVQLDQCIAPL